MGLLPTLILMCFAVPFAASSAEVHHHSRATTEDADSKSRGAGRRVVDAKGGPESVVWVVQLSDLHFSMFHPDRAHDFRSLIGPALSMINPSLVLITGDLTDGKSKDLLIMKQNEEEWAEYQSVMEDVVKRSGLDKSIFYDLRGNHDSFGVPVVGDSFDFFSKYSINGQLGRSRNVNSVTVQTGSWNYLFVGFDSAMSIGLRGPTNLFGHPTVQLLTDIDSELSQWDSLSTKPVTKITFGHFPLSFSAASPSAINLEDIFLKHSLSAYLCGHLHTRFGKNLKRHHQSGHNFQKNLQLNIHQIPSESIANCLGRAPPLEEFWEWEMGDWRKSRMMRILAIDRGHVSFVDIDFKAGARKTIILPTFPLDSRFMLTASSPHKYSCEVNPSSNGMIRALVFSVSPIVLVVARIYDSRPGDLNMVMETPMTKQEDNSSRGDLYSALWNFKAFEDPSPDRYWLQIEAVDIMGRSSLTELRPFSITGHSARVLWTWKEFFVMGCQWDALYYPIIWFSLSFLFIILFTPKALLIFTNRQHTYKNFSNNKGLLNGLAWFLTELCSIPIIWFGMLGYLFYLVLFPWFFGQVFTDDGGRGYMTYKGWVLKTSDERKKLEFIGSPDIMVVVIPHLLFVVLPAILVAGGLSAEREVYRIHFLTLSGKKEDDYGWENKGSMSYDYQGTGRLKLNFQKRWIRKFLLVVLLAICWQHFKSCRALMKAYAMNPILHFPVYSLSIPLLLLYVVYRTSKV
ncbi:putative metallophosphoesterase At3g03305 isoform X2 [Malania oleifera]|uniref:putative metallophosphoesterase At3g03305 isoform X2 n=1 Tax=Malania oleifera TaxID=397392 RepID=UPI0025ADC067|nr:putative metallophosphoesterase At3g03305 isoform X2 [Malania oleifera]